LIICTDDNIQHLKPEKYITDHDEENYYPKWWRLHLWKTGVRYAPKEPPTL
jgi:hypothetical protein